MTAGAPGEDGIGGTGVTAAADGGDDGIGGTGMTAAGAGDDDGIGGTGIIGTITGFGSIWVNGLEIETPASVEVLFNGEPGSVAALAVGQVVELVADGAAAGLVARRVRVDDAVVGSVEAVDAATGTLVVMGQRVRLDGATLLDGVAGPGALRVGDRLRVSGLRAGDDAIVATRVQPAAAGAADIVHGPVRLTADGRPAIGALPLAGLAADAVPAAGEVAYVRGRLLDGALRVASVRVAPARPFGGEVARVVVEGTVGRSGRLIDPAGRELGLGGAAGLPPAGVRVVAGVELPPRAAPRLQRLDPAPWPRRPPSAGETGARGEAPRLAPGVNRLPSIVAPGRPFASQPGARSVAPADRRHRPAVVRRRRAPAGRRPAWPAAARATPVAPRRRARPDWRPAALPAPACRAEDCRRRRSAREQAVPDPATPAAPPACRRRRDWAV